MQDNKETELLKQQVREIMEEEAASKSQGNKGQAYRNQAIRPDTYRSAKSKTKNKKGSKIFISILIGLLLVIVLLIGTKSGRRIFYRTAGNFIYSNMEKEAVKDDVQPVSGDNNPGFAVRSEDYVTNYLIFGIEEFGGARNTDSMMIASINTKDNTIKLTSLLRDSYVDIPGYKSNKLNAAYSRGGAKKLIETIEKNYKIQIDGYASVNFKSFEKIVDSLGGIKIELGEKEAHYLNTTNYISKKSNRNVKPGVNLLNGNQVLGYCRVRKVETLGGINNDYGRIVRQQRALSAIFKSFKSKNIFEQIKITKECLGYLTTNLTEKQIDKSIEDVAENRIKTLDTFRVPVDGAFDDPRLYNGIGYPLVLDWKTNRIELFKYIFLDTEKEAKAELAKLSE
jgi:LCP family protein required for cell wall assembly